MKEKMSTIEKIEYIYENIPECKNDPKLLILVYWQLFDNIVFPENVLDLLINKATTPETITRVSRNAKGNSTAATKELVEEKLKEMGQKFKEEE